MVHWMRTSYFVSIAVVFIFYTTFVFLGDVTIRRADHDDCSSPFYTEAKHARYASVTTYTLFLVLASTLIMTLWFLELEWTFYARTSLGVCWLGVIISGLIMVVAVVSETCIVDAANVTDSQPDKEVEGIAIMTLILCCVLGVQREWWTYNNNNNKHHSINITRLNRFNLIIRTMLGIALLSIMSNTSDASFRGKFIDETLYNSMACREARSYFDTTSYLYKHFYVPIRIVDLTNVNMTISADYGTLVSVQPNKAMLGLSILIILFIGVEYYAEYIHVFTTKAAQHGLSLIRCSVYVSFGIFITSFILANEIQSCPSFDVNNNKLLQWTYTCMALFLAETSMECYTRYELTREPDTLFKLDDLHMNILQ